MARPKRTEGRDTRREILDAALELFSERGLHGTTLRDIAQAVGIQPGAVTYHFESKEELFDAVLSHFMNEARAELHVIVSAPLPDDLAPFFENLLVHILETFSVLREKKLFRIVIGEGLKLAGDRRLRALEEIAPRVEMTRFLDRLVRAGKLEGDPELLTLELMGPVLVWRILLDAAPRSRLDGDVRQFAKRHVAHFLKAAGFASTTPTTARKLNKRPTQSRSTAFAKAGKRSR